MSKTVGTLSTAVRPVCRKLFAGIFPPSRVTRILGMPVTRLKSESRKCDALGADRPDFGGRKPRGKANYKKAHHSH